MIVLSRPQIGPEEIAAVTEVLESGMLASGKLVAQFEEEFAAAVGVEHAVAVGSGTIDGGAGNDILNFGGAGLTLNTNSVSVVGVETINLTGAGGNILALSAEDVIDELRERQSDFEARQDKLKAALARVEAAA